MDTCACCHLPKFEAPVSATDKRPHVCPDCMKHWGTQEAKRIEREKAHLDAWLAFHSEVCSQLSARIERERTAREAAEARAKDLQIALSDATRTIADGYFKAEVGEELRRVIETEVVRDEQAQRDSAYRALGRANGALLDVAELHEEVQNSGKCKCGKPTRSCKELAALAPIEAALFKWEKNQIERMRKGQRHDLRRDHPEARKYQASHSRDLWEGLPPRPDRADQFQRQRWF